MIEHFNAEIAVGVERANTSEDLAHVPILLKGGGRAEAQT